MCAFKIRIGQATKYFENHSIRKTFFICKTRHFFELLA